MLPRISVLLLGLLPLALTAAQDPTRPAMYATAGETHSQGGLKSIVRNGKEAYAIVGNRIVAVGDQLNGLRITAIGADYLQLSDGSRLTLFKPVTER
ncbi:MSHA biogenesis protein MshK [Shewanella cyperi]|uniref:MSHA biogenesis protein MshK n=1 Tax=Shewanella cyperi TaxID=2814292 RepID=UPI001A93CEB2|nr:MSHA biogenesis protein MshK [Shewanella cyperi]QSX40469.1 MSHA biogenesis protein MshK [Shewanella cyperi]